MLYAGLAALFLPNLHFLFPQHLGCHTTDCPLENDLGHTLYHGMRIREKARRGRSFIPPGMLQRWKTEAMGEFTSPIFPDRWELPAGAFGAEMAGAV